MSAVYNEDAVTAVIEIHPDNLAKQGGLPHSERSSGSGYERRET